MPVGNAARELCVWMNGNLRNRSRDTMLGLKDWLKSRWATAKSRQLERRRGVKGNLLQGKNALITGAGRNIGRSTAIEMAKQGANIFFTDIDETRCRRVEEELNTYGSKSKGYLSDVSRTDDNDRLYGTLTRDGIRIDVLVNNVGVSANKPQTGSFDVEEWRNVYETNVLGPVHLTGLISGMMIRNAVHGSIIFISSIHQWGIRLDAAYSSSKGAIGMIIKELAYELAPHRIRVNGIAPGGVGEDARGGALERREVPLHGSTINPEYIGRAAVYLASDYFSKFTTGAVITIDAGVSLHTYLSLNRARAE